ncbi:Leucine-rich repeat, cysteine-containing subtype [Artemisia annua]|uniref:Leucine-rich repeat, cysteine-containing subtype n=1 Tax=Artemisia annua TaxID=35608 RepID=A0A2U1Q8F3_ARTAN|nr:Leucine-rich repeat, cysteine-containing subtype [Artemisia annua]
MTKAKAKLRIAANYKENKRKNFVTEELETRLDTEKGPLFLYLDPVTLIYLRPCLLAPMFTSIFTVIGLGNTMGSYYLDEEYDDVLALHQLIGEQVRPLPLDCDWEEILEPYKAHIFPALETYFNLAPWLNDDRRVTVGENVYTVGERRCPNFEVIDATYGTGATGLEVIGQFCKKLRILKTSELVFHVGLIVVAQGCVVLNCLHVRLTTITNEAIKKLERLGIHLCPGGLTDVGLGISGRESDLGLAELSKGCPKYRKLKIKGCPSKQVYLGLIVFNIHLLSIESLDFSYVNFEEINDKDLILLAKDSSQSLVSLKFTIVEAIDLLRELLNYKMYFVSLDVDCPCFLIQRCPNFEVIDATYGIGATGLQVIGQFCKKLRILKTCELVSHMGLIAVTRMC